MFAKNTFIIQYANATNDSVLKRLMLASMSVKKKFVSADKLSSDSPVLLVPAANAAKSRENMFCSVMQNLYSSTGSTPIREQAKKPFKILSAVVFTFALPHWYSIAVSNTATTVPAANKDHPKSPNSFTVAFTHSSPNISAPILPISLKNSATALYTARYIHCSILSKIKPDTFSLSPAKRSFNQFRIIPLSKKHNI